MNQNTKAISAINHLIIRNTEAMNGYVEVANNINSKLVTRWLIDFSRQRSFFIRELKKIASALGGKPEMHTTFLGELHHFWIDLKAQWMDNNIEDLLNECLRGEKTLISTYEEILSQNVLYAPMENVVKNQLAKIVMAVENLQLLQKTISEEKMLV